MDILVTGASGMLGQALMRRLRALGRTLGTTHSGRTGLISCDLSKPEAVAALFAGHPFGLVVHSAAASDVDGCEREPAAAYADNALSTRNLAHACAPKRIPFIYISTDYVFRGDKREPYVETDPVFPVNVYGMTKLAGEVFARTCAPVSAVVRTSWLFGAENPKNFVNWAIEALRTKERLSVLDDQRDCPTYVEDLAAAILPIATRLLQARGTGSVSELYHVCNAGATTRHAMTLEMRRLLGRNGVEVGITDRASMPARLAVRPGYVAMSTAHYERTFGTVLRPWQEAMAQFIHKDGLCAS